MKRKNISLVLLSLCFVAQASDAATTEASSRLEVKLEKRPVSASERREHADRVRCVNEQITGSRFYKRICQTEEEWERLREAGVEAVRNIQNRPVPL